MHISRRHQHPALRRRLTLDIQGCDLDLNSGDMVVFTCSDIVLLDNLGLDMAQKYGLGGLDGGEFLPSGGWIPGMLAGWRGRAHVKDGRYSVVLDNVVSHMESDQLQLALGKGLAKMTVEPNLTMVNKQKKDHGHLSTVLQHVHGVTIPPEQAEDILLDYYASIANICLDIKTDITTVPGDEDKFEWQDAAPTDDFWCSVQVTDNNQRKAIEATLATTERVNYIKGPPATRKTTTIAKSICTAIAKKVLKS